jgi:hypothetical protein
MYIRVTHKMSHVGILYFILKKLICFNWLEAKTSLQLSLGVLRPWISLLVIYLLGFSFGLFVF